MLISTYNTMVVVAFGFLILALTFSFFEKSQNAKKDVIHARYVQKIMMMGIAAYLFIILAMSSTTLTNLPDGASCLVCNTDSNAGMTIGYLVLTFYCCAMIIIWIIQWLGDQ